MPQGIGIDVPCQAQYSSYNIYSIYINIDDFIWNWFLKTYLLPSRTVLYHEYLTGQHRFGEKNAPEASRQFFATVQNKMHWAVRLLAPVS
jgi:valyl-tRNA synthetase